MADTLEARIHRYIILFWLKEEPLRRENVSSQTPKKRRPKWKPSVHDGSSRSAHTTYQKYEHAQLKKEESQNPQVGPPKTHVELLQQKPGRLADVCHVLAFPS